MRKKCKKMKITSHKWHAFTDEVGGSGREVFLKHKYFILPCSWANLFLITRKDHRNIIFYDKILLFIKTDQKLCSKNTLFHGIHGYYFKKHSSLFWHNLKPIWVQKAKTGPISHQGLNIVAFIQHYCASKSKPPSNSSPPLGNIRQNREDMAVVRKISQIPFNRRNAGTFKRGQLIIIKFFCLSFFGSLHSGDRPSTMLCVIK